MACVLLATMLACKGQARRSRDLAGDSRCPATATQAYAYCGLPDEVAAHALVDQCVPWPNRPPNQWMAFCCPVPEEEIGIGVCGK